MVVNSWLFDGCFTCLQACRSFIIRKCAPGEDFEDMRVLYVVNRSMTAIYVCIYSLERMLYIWAVKHPASGKINSPRCAWFVGKEFEE